MTLFDSRNLDKLTPQQRKDYETFMKAYPHLQPKMETSRQLNTPAVEEQQRIARASVAEEFDPSAIEQDQRAQASEPPKPPKPLGTMNIDAKRNNMQSLKQDQEEEKKLRRKMQEDPEEQVNEPKRPAAPKVKPFSPLGKKHPVLQKMRASLGLDELEKPAKIALQGVTYEMRRLTREDIARATSLATFRSLDEAEMRSNIENSIVCYAVKKIDNTSLEEIFEIPHSELKITTGKEERLTSIERADRGAQQFFEFLRDSPSELTEALVVFYEQSFPPVNLKGATTSYGLCPAEGCNYKALIGSEETRFCPIHGQELVREEALPNPS